MTNRVSCPECAAHLELPSLAGEPTVQCPRCQHVFVPTQPKPIAAPTPATPLHVDESMADALPFIMYSGPLAGKTLAKVAMALLAVSTLSFGVELYFRYEHIQLLEQAPHLDPPRGDFFLEVRAVPLNPAERALQERWDDWLQFSQFTNVFHHLTFWPALLAFLMWLNRACHNARNLGAQGMNFPPDAAVLSFFMPFFNLVGPFQAMQELWRASSPELVRTPQEWKNASGSPLIWAWWICFLIATGLYLFAYTIRADEFSAPEQQSRYEAFLCLSRSAVLIEGTLLIFIIHGVMRRQTARQEKLIAISEEENVG